MRAILLTPEQAENLENQAGRVLKNMTEFLEACRKAYVELEKKRTSARSSRSHMDWGRAPSVDTTGIVEKYGLARGYATYRAMEEEFLEIMDLIEKTNGWGPKAVTNLKADFTFLDLTPLMELHGFYNVKFGVTRRREAEV